MIKFNIIKDFRLHVKAEYKDLDACIDEICRKGKFNPSLAEKDIEKYLKDDATILLSWLVMLLGISLLSFITSFIYNISYTDTIGSVSLIISLVFYAKFKTKMKDFNFNKGVLMSFMSLENSISD